MTKQDSHLGMPDYKACTVLPFFYLNPNVSIGPKHIVLFVQRLVRSAHSISKTFSMFFLTPSPNGRKRCGTQVFNCFTLLQSNHFWSFQRQMGSKIETSHLFLLEIQNRALILSLNCNSLILFYQTSNLHIHLVLANM